MQTTEEKIEGQSPVGQIREVRERLPYRQRIMVGVMPAVDEEDGHEAIDSKQQAKTAEQ